MLWGLLLVLLRVLAHDKGFDPANYYVDPEGGSIEVQDFEVLEEPTVRFLTQSGERRETGGQLGCFGVDGVYPNHLISIESLTPGIGVDYYGDYDCVPGSQINIQRPQDDVGYVEHQVHGTDVRSIRLLKMEHPVGYDFDRGL